MLILLLLYWRREVLETRMTFSLLTDCIEIATSCQKSNLYRNILKHLYGMPTRLKYCSCYCSSSSGWLWWIWDIDADPSLILTKLLSRQQELLKFQDGVSSRIGRQTSWFRAQGLGLSPLGLVHIPAVPTIMSPKTQSAAEWYWHQNWHSCWNCPLRNTEDRDTDAAALCSLYRCLFPLFGIKSVLQCSPSVS